MKEDPQSVGLLRRAADAADGGGGRWRERVRGQPGGHTLAHARQESVSGEQRRRRDLRLFGLSFLGCTSTTEKEQDDHFTRPGMDFSPAVALANQGPELKLLPHSVARASF